MCACAFSRLVSYLNIKNLGQSVWVLVHWSSFSTVGWRFSASWLQPSSLCSLCMLFQSFFPIAAQEDANLILLSLFLFALCHLTAGLLVQLGRWLGGRQNAGGFVRSKKELLRLPMAAVDGSGMAGLSGQISKNELVTLTPADWLCDRINHNMQQRSSQYYGAVF